MKTRVLKYLLIVFVISIVTFSCRKSNNRNSKNNKSEVHTEITICQWGQALIYLPLYIAQQEGYFKDEGLKVNIINGGADDLTWAAVTSGNAQFGIADPTMIAVQGERGGVPGRIIGDIVQKVAFWAVTLDTSIQKIVTPENFRGHKVACFKFPNTAHALALRTFHNGNLKVGEDVSLIEVNYSAVLSQLQNNEASLAMVLEPAASNAELTGNAKVVYSYPEEWGTFAFTGLTCTQKYIDENPEIVQKVINALNRAMKTAHEDFKTAVKVGQKEFPDLEMEVIERAVTRMINSGTLPKTITPSYEGWNKAIQVCIDVDKLKNAPDPNTMIDTSFAHKSVNQRVLQEVK